MRLGMEKNFLFGVKARVEDTKNAKRSCLQAEFGTKPEVNSHTRKER